MSLHDDRISMLQMLDYARDAVKIASGRSRHELDKDIMLQYALTRVAEVVGEAARRVSEETRCEHPNIPWKSIVGLRNRLIHGYDKVNLDILWDVVQLNLPSLIQQLEEILNE